MISKIATAAGAVALFLGSVTPIMASTVWPVFTMPSYDVTNTAFVSTDVTAKAYTGDNTQKVYGSGSNEMGTGDAYADASAVTFANLFDGCGGCVRNGDVYNYANVNTHVYAKADTGDNSQRVYGGVERPTVQVGLFNYHPQQPTAKNWMWTGDAAAVGSSFTVVNASWIPAN